MFLLPFLLNKAVLIGLSLVVVGSTTVYGGIKAVEYRDTQISLQEAKQLSSEGKYQEAINKLNITENKWSPSETKEKIRLAIEENKQLIGSSKDYELGKELFDKGNYKDSLVLFKKVDSRNINYPSVLSLIELAEKRLSDIPKSEVVGTSSQSEVKVKAAAPIKILTPTSFPTLIPIPTSQPTPAIDPVIVAELRNILSEANRLGANRANATVALNFYLENQTKAQASGQGPIFQSDIDAQRKIIEDADNKGTELQYRINILVAKCPACWAEVKR